MRHAYLLLLTFSFFLIAQTAVAQPSPDVDPLVDLNPGPESSDPESLFDFNGELLFTADPDTLDRGLYLSSGNVGEATRLGTINQDTFINGGEADPKFYTIFQNAVFFAATNAVNGRELWRTDGTPDGTALFLDLRPGALDGNPTSLTVFAGQLWFVASDIEGERRLFRTGGSAQGTTQFTDLDLGGAGSGNLAVLDTLLYFTAAGAETGNRELWRTNGTEAGTFAVTNFGGAGDPDNFFGYQGLLYFSAIDATSGRELYRTSGSSVVATELVRDLNVGAGSSNPRDFFTAGGLLFFTADDPFVGGRELYISDGTTEGTQLYIDLNVNGSSNPRGFTAFNDDYVVFSAERSTTGRELVALSALGAEGNPDDISFEFLDIAEGEIGSDPRNFVSTGQDIYFTATTPEEGRELYRFTPSDAAVLPTRITTVFAGPEDGDPRELILVDGVLYFVLTNEENGREVFRLPVPTAQIEVLTVLGDIVSGDTLDVGTTNVGLSTQLTLFLGNSGNANLTIFSQEVSGDTALFNLGPENEDENIFFIGQDSISVVATFTPQEEGEFSATYRLLSSSVKDRTFVLTLKGTALAGFRKLGARLLFDDSELPTEGGAVGFDEVSLGSDSLIRIELANRGSLPIVLGPAQLTNTIAFAVNSLVDTLRVGQRDTLEITFSPTAKELFTTQLTVETDSTDTFFTILLTGTGVDPLATVDLVARGGRVYPNPTADRVRLELPTVAGSEAQLSLLDLAGRVLRRMDLGGRMAAEVNLAGLPAGWYTLRVEDAGEVLVTRVLKLGSR